MKRLLVSICFMVVLMNAALSQTLSVEGKHIGSTFVDSNGNENTAYNGVQLLMSKPLFSHTDREKRSHESLTLSVGGNYGYVEHGHITPDSYIGNMGTVTTALVYLKSLSNGWTFVNATNGGWQFSTGGKGADSFYLNNVALFIRRVNSCFSWGVGMMMNSNDWFVPFPLPFVSVNQQWGDFRFAVNLPQVTISRDIARNFDLKLHLLDMDVLNSSVCYEGKDRLYSHFGLKTTLQPEVTVGKFRMFAKIGYNWYKNITVRKRSAAGIFRKKHKIHLDETDADWGFSVGVRYNIPSTGSLGMF